MVLSTDMTFVLPSRMNVNDVRSLIGFTAADGDGDNASAAAFQAWSWTQGGNSISAYPGNVLLAPLNLLQWTDTYGEW